MSQRWILVFGLLGTFLCSASSFSAPPSCNRFLRATTAFFSHQVLSDDELEVMRLFKNDPSFNAWIERFPMMIVYRNTASQILASYREMRAQVRVPVLLGTRTVNLTGRQLNEPSPVLCDFCNRFPEEIKDSLVSPTTYMQRVFSLRRGDWVKFSDGSFLLGKFQGRDGSGHVFEIEDQPGEVIQIPIAIAKGVSVETNREAIRKAEEGYPRIPATIPHIEILKRSADHAYLVLSKVDGTLNGKTYIENATRLDRASRKMLRLRTLVLRMIRRLGEGDLYDQMGFHFQEKILRDTASQFVYDETKRDWILTDWEGL